MAERKGGGSGSEQGISHGAALMLLGGKRGVRGTSFPQKEPLQQHLATQQQGNRRTQPAATQHIGILVLSGGKSGGRSHNWLQRFKSLNVGKAAIISEEMSSGVLHQNHFL